MHNLHLSINSYGPSTTEDGYYVFTHKTSMQLNRNAGFHLVFQIPKPGSSEEEGRPKLAAGQTKNLLINLWTASPKPQHPGFPPPFQKSLVASLFMAHYSPCIAKYAATRSLFLITFLLSTQGYPHIAQNAKISRGHGP